VVTRRGNPFDAEDLARVNAYRARRVVILHPHETDVGLLGEGGGEGGDSKSHKAAALDAESERFQKQQREEALKATVVLNLLADGSRETTPDVIVQMPYRLDEKSDLVGHALRLSQRPGLVDPNLKGHTFRSGEASPAPSSSPYVQVHGSENSGKIGAISAFQPGASRIFEELFKQSDDSPEFYLSLAPSLVGKTFGEAWRSLPRATLCGLSHADGTVTLAPRDDVVIAHDDEVVMLSETSTVQIARPGEASASTPPRGSQRHYMRCIAGEKPQAVSILFAGWNTETATALQLAQSVAPAGSEITVLSDSVPKETLAKLKSTKKCKLRVLQGLPTSYDDLLRAKVQEMDAVVIMPDHAQGKAEEDASVLATMLQTHAICVDAAPGLGDPHIVATLNTDSARSIVELMGKIGAGDTVPDVIMSDDLVGGALLQVAANPKLAGLFDALLATDGHEIYLRDADLFGGMDTRVEGEGPVTWGTLCERARERNELAIGVLRADGELAISPAKAEAFAFEEGDKIIVLAEDL
jgi:Trk K+ transport system NAD-binding subunit